MKKNCVWVYLLGLAFAIVIAISMKSNKNENENFTDEDLANDVFSARGFRSLKSVLGRTKYSDLHRTNNRRMPKLLQN
jgi:hypothetical protein